MRGLTRLHPVTVFLWFLFMIVFSVILLNPVCLVISSICAFLYAVFLKKGEAVKYLVYFGLPVAITSTILNPLFNHIGKVLFYVFGVPVTLEALLYGLAAGVMLLSVLFWFFSFQIVFPAENIQYLMQKISPGIALTISMVFQFIPRVKEHLKNTKDAFLGIGIIDENDGFLKTGAKVISASVLPIIENSMETADYMSCMGFGTRKRTSYLAYKFHFADFVFIGITLIASTTIVYGIVSGKFDFSYYPYFTKIKDVPLFYISYLILAILPILYDGKEEIKWTLLKSKI
ncbi:MAG: hypothetical protein IKJ06_04125 [Clostridia bacterium]|nr:hypothetical protein [Clostridia bacterium]